MSADGTTEPEGVPTEPRRVLEPAKVAPTGKVTEVIGLNGQPAKVPSGVWFAATDGTGNLATDADGRPLRVRSPHRPPSAPLGG